MQMQKYMLAIDRSILPITHRHHRHHHHYHRRYGMSEVTGCWCCCSRKVVVAYPVCLLLLLLLLPVASFLILWPSSSTRQRHHWRVRQWRIVDPTAMSYVVTTTSYVFTSASTWAPMSNNNPCMQTQTHTQRETEREGWKTKHKKSGNGKGCCGWGN